MLLLFLEEAAGLVPAPSAALSPWCRQSHSAAPACLWYMLVHGGRAMGNLHSLQANLPTWCLLYPKQRHLYRSTSSREQGNDGSVQKYRHYYYIWTLKHPCDTSRTNAEDMTALQQLHIVPPEKCYPMCAKVCSWGTD